ncbi:MAG: ABC transporter permease [Acidobacteria bacterium]|nr:ABC transporter permease [Acidobacteriota bacterium]MCI0720889.1 ABC transporter permease [Acidobacteriota bacterium]
MRRLTGRLKDNTIQISRRLLAVRSSGCPGAGKKSAIGTRCRASAAGSTSRTRSRVLSAAQVNFTPLIISGSGWNNNVGPDGAVAGGSGKESYFNRVGPGYFRTMGTPLIAGRDFNDSDTLSSPKVAIVNELFASKFFGGSNPVGRTFHRETEAGKPEPS